MVELDWNNIPKDLCPVCKTDKYLSPTLQFKINPECYHKICDSCVDRIFSLGPSPCPYPNCGKILRKNRFKTQIFDDVEVERECDVRKRVVAVYNKTQEDFKTLDEYNAYLEEIEEYVYKLVNKIDVEQTEQKLKEYQQAHKDDIEMSNNQRDQEYEKFLKLQNLEKRYKAEKNKINREIIKEEQNLKNLGKLEVINQLQTASGEKDADKIIANVRDSMISKTSNYKEQLEELEKNYQEQRERIISGLDEIKEEEKPKVPFTPFNGDRVVSPPYEYGDYKDPFLLKIVDDVQYKAGGYKIDFYFHKSLNDAFTGLHCIIEEEKETVDQVMG
ncbi:hypothetical protein KL942_003743 [Ogataea angusta]|uniref:RNA polymerase II transcription factor B subunit 3 n=1 Tax=Pichia angusta TaxID=870730 RepID=A0ABQ7RWP0_PICAN|nr:hypothetical protein KL942_003743 [Ogataea angusta]KAG7849509.1 hypothetical protein KL940_002539 [Ogataea angusta]KAG7857953.1 hypothetical protein KL939_003209 [Ogataea angusta]